MFCRVARVTGGRAESRIRSWVYMALDTPIAQRIVVEAAALHAPDGCEQLIIICRIADRIDRACVHDQKGRRFVLVEEARVRLVETLEIIALDVLLVDDAAPRNA